MKKLAFVFSGQGAQYTGMGKEIYEGNIQAKKVFDCVDKVLGRKISEICFEGDEKLQGQTVNTQPCVFSVDLAVAKMLEEEGLVPDGVAGFSLGEYAALCFAGGLDPECASELVQTRAEAMQRAVPEGRGAMAAIIGLEVGEIEAMCCDEEDNYTSISNYNSPQQIVVAGDSDAITKLIENVNETGARAVRLMVSVPSHCRLMKSAADEMKKVLENADMSIPKIPTYFNFSGETCSNIELIKKMMINQIQCPVKWTQTILNMYNDGYRVFIECGPGKTLTGLIKKILKGKDFEAYHVEDINTMRKVVSDIKNGN